VSGTRTWLGGRGLLTVGVAASCVCCVAHLTSCGLCGGTGEWQSLRARRCGVVASGGLDQSKALSWVAHLACCVVYVAALVSERFVSSET
jgi:hypothetical protein